MTLPFEISFSAVFKEIGAYLMSVLLTLFSFAAEPQEGYAPLDADSLQAQFSVISDAHIEINPAERGVIRFEALRESLLDMSRACVPNDALVMAGDNTENGQQFEYLALYNGLAWFNKADHLLIAMGNHETFGLNHNQSYARAISNFIVPYNLYARHDIDKSYYYRVIKGYYFVVMGTEAVLEGTAAYISPEQLAWLDGTLAEATTGGKPVFLINHQPFLGSHGTTHEAEGMGEQNDAVYAIVSKYKNVFYFSGHIHRNLAANSYERTAEGVNLISVPSLGKSDIPGCGVQVEVYPERVELRGRNFSKNQWIDDFSIQVPLDWQ